MYQYAELIRVESRQPYVEVEYHFSGDTSHWKVGDVIYPELIIPGSGSRYFWNNYDNGYPNALGKVTEIKGQGHFILECFFPHYFM